MKKLLVFLCVMFAGAAFAHTINWHVGDQIISTTTCSSGDNITPPTAPAKYGYHLKGWRQPYTELEYIESTGTQYIDTGFKPNQDTKVEVDFEFSTSLAPNVVFFCSSAGWSGASFGLYIGINGLIFSNYNDDIVISDLFSPVLNTRYLYTQDKSNIYINGTLKYIHNPAIFQSTENLLLGRVYLHSAYYFKGKYYSAKIYDNDILVRDFIPAKDQNGVVGMFDTVTNTFFENAGTGEFIAGPESGYLQ